MKVKIIAFLFFFPTSFYGQVLSTKLIANNKDSTVRYVKIVNFSPLYRDFDLPLNILAESNLDTLNSFQLDLKISKIGNLALMVMNKTQSVFVTPGDQITFSIIQKKNAPHFIFYGKNAPHYSYSNFSDEYIEYNKAYPLFKNDKGIHFYKINLDNWLNLKLKFLSDYELSNKVSDDFLKYSRQEIEYEYIKLLYAPVNSNEIEFKNLPLNYFALADTFFKRNSYTIQYFTGNSMLAYTFRYIIYKEENFKENFDLIYENINGQFKGQTRSFLLTNLIGVYVKAQSDIYRVSLVKLINEAPKFILDPMSLSYIERREIEYNKLNRNFPDEVLSKTYLKNINSDSIISLKELLDQHKGDATYIDFWARWCIPCREDNATSTMAKEFLKSRQVKYIYISIDKEADEMKWKKASRDDKITMDQYILMNGLKADLAQYLKVTSIPRYIILNKVHKLKSIDAPRPNFTQLDKLKGAIINATKN